MKIDTLDDVRIIEEKALISPAELKALLPLSGAHRHSIIQARKIINDIINKKDPRLMVVCGPCSIHSAKATLEYAQKLKTLSEKIGDQCYLVMQVDFKKHTEVTADNSLNHHSAVDSEHDLCATRQLLIELTDIGVPLAFETVDANIPQYLGDLFSWAAIGERITDLPLHREIASGLSMPIGFKNGADGDLDVAIKALKSSAQPHSFVGINQQGQVSLLKTKGNLDTHVILREGDMRDCRANNIAQCEIKMERAELEARIMIDCSRGNINREGQHQLTVIQSVVEQIKHGNRGIIGIMLQSCLRHSLPQLSLVTQHNDSVATHDCLDWHNTELVLTDMAEVLADILARRQLVRSFASIHWD